MLDGYPIVVGDQVFDIVLNRSGTVLSVGPATQFRVDMGGDSPMVYHGNGMFVNVKRLYWRNPILTLPRKADSQWAMIQNVVNAIRGV
jgi:hypothetical protein